MSSKYPENNPNAHSLREAAGEETLEGYAAMNVTDTGERDEIAKLAHHYYEQRQGKGHGSPEEDWHRAERELRNRKSASAKAK